MAVEITKWQIIERYLQDRMNNPDRDDHLAPGDQLPSVNDLVQERKMAASTVRRAYDELAKAGLIEKTGKTDRYRVSGLRAFPIKRRLIINLSKEEGGLEPDPSGDRPVELDAYRAAVLHQGLIPITLELTVSMAAPSATDELELNLQPDEQLVRREVKRYFARKPDANTEPIFIDSEGAPDQYDVRTKEPGSLQRTFYPDTLTEEAPRLQSVKDIAEGTIRYLTSCNLVQEGYRDIVDSRNATPDEAAFFDMSGLQPVTEVRRIAYTREGRPLRLTQTVFDAARHLISYETGVVPPAKFPKQL
ncbi:GntR family transcriptional regulator [Nonomuraea sp. NPDC050643]|uniref:GntR family transcriptional regulator n=1 Tax=Nonomuraea sp. NPDC050643 TaxID=3155660 RepID=UPI00340EA416